MPDEPSEVVDFTAAAETEERGPAARVVRYAPAALFAFAVAVAVVTVVLNPMTGRERPREPDEYYQAARQALDELEAPDEPAGRPQRLRQLVLARDNLMRLVHHHNDHPQVRRGDFGNPYLLLADTNRRLAEVVVRDSRRDTLHSEAVRDYDRALTFEARMQEQESREAEDGAPVRFGPNGPAPSAEEIHRERRNRYITYHRAVTNLALGRRVEARNALEGLRDELFRREMAALRAQRQGLPAPRTAEPGRGPFELSEEERIKLHYHLGRIYQHSDLRDKAEAEYRVFLLKSPRSRERFLAQLQLAEMAFRQGRDELDRAMRIAGPEREDMLARARESLREAGLRYEEVVDASAPEDLLRRAYFRGGQAKLELADSMGLGRETWWDVIEAKGAQLRTALERWSGTPLPRRTQLLPGVLGQGLLAQSVRAPMLPGSLGGLGAGGGLALATRERVTPRDTRDQLLAEARRYFDAAGGAGSEFEAEARVMIGESLLVQGRLEDARRIFRHAMAKYLEPEAQVGARLGLGASYLRAGKLEEAWKVYQELPPADELVDTPLFTAEDIVGDLEALARAHVDRADALRYPRDWLDEPSDSVRWLDAVRRSQEMRRALAHAAAVNEHLHASYPQPGPDVLVRTAGLYARRSELLYRRPFGRPQERDQARELAMRAADTYMRVATEMPGTAQDEDVIFRAGNLFFEAGAYERAAESFEEFTRRHGQSERLGQARNMLGLAYQRLGLFERAANVFHANAVERATAEGRKSLYYLGETYLKWGGPRLGGPNSPLLAQEHTSQSLVGENRLRERDVADWSRLVARLQEAAGALAPSPSRRILRLLGSPFERRVASLPDDRPPPPTHRQAILEGLNSLLARADLYDPAAWRGTELNPELTDLLRRIELAPEEVARMNRLLLEAAYPEGILPASPTEGPVRLPRTAREVFAHVRGLPGLGPQSRPWRWSTFALGETLFTIAQTLQHPELTDTDRARVPGAAPPAAPEQAEAEQAAPEPAQAPGAQAATAPAGEEEEEEEEEEGETGQPAPPEVYRPYYRKAAAVLTEALDRYVLYPDHPDGLRREQQETDFLDVLQSRYRATYFLALCRLELGQEQRGDGAGAQGLLRRIIDEDRYGAEVWAENPLMGRIRRNAHIHLGLSLYRTGDYMAAYEVFEQAQQRLRTSERPYLLYMMGECLLAMGRTREARNKYISARNAVRTAGAPDTGGFPETFGVEFWQRRNEERLRDLQDLASLGRLEL